MYFTEHDGASMASEIIIDHDYNTKFTLDYLLTSEDSWQVSLTVSAIDPSRAVKIVPFLYLTADNTMPLTTSVERDNGTFVKVA